MANIYVRSAAAGGGTGVDWANAYTKLATALNAAGTHAGDDIWVSEDHAETTAAQVDLTPPGTATSPNRIICVNHSGSVPPVSADLRTTASIQSTGQNNLNVNGGFAYWYGITFDAANGSSGGNPNLVVGNGDPCGHIFKNCVLFIDGTSGNSGKGINFGNVGNLQYESITLIDTQLKFGSAFVRPVFIVCDFYWSMPGGAAGLLGTAPTTALFVLNNGGSSGSRGNATIVGVDLSALGAVPLVDVSDTHYYRMYFVDCKLGSGYVNTLNAVTNWGANTVEFINCDSGATNNRFYRQDYFATESQELTIVRTGGASDGTNQFSGKIVTTANTKFYAPYFSDWMEIWVDSAAAHTVTVYTITSNVTLKNVDCWIEVEGGGNSLGVFATTAAADVLQAGANNTTDTSTWGGSLATPVKQSMTANITTNGKQVLRVRIAVAKASTTVYYDPLPVVT